jgi:hypothetical protein
MSAQPSKQRTWSWVGFGVAALAIAAFAIAVDGVISHFVDARLGVVLASVTMLVLPFVLLQRSSKRRSSR